MINFVLGDFVRCLDWLDRTCSELERSPDVPVHDHEHGNLVSQIEPIVFRTLSKLRISDARIALNNVQDLLNRHGSRFYTYGELAAALRRVRNDVSEGAKHEFFFHYPTVIAELVYPVIEGYSVNAQWQPVVLAFPTAKREIEAGLDCYAFDDLSGCVFHMMRIAELGLRAIARERGIEKVGGKKNKPLEWGTWKEVSDAIRDALKEIMSKPPGPKRDAAHAFYEIALDKMRFMQGLYRDPTMHFRDKYEKGEAFDAISNVYNFMITLSDKLDEAHPNRRIPWEL